MSSVSGHDFKSGIQSNFNLLNVVMHCDFDSVSARGVLRLDPNSHAFLGKLDLVCGNNKLALQSNSVFLLAIDTAVRLQNNHVIGHIHGAFGIGAWINEENHCKKRNVSKRLVILQRYQTWYLRLVPVLKKLGALS